MDSQTKQTKIHLREVCTSMQSRQQLKVRRASNAGACFKV
jgi:hypothetical protein